MQHSFAQELASLPTLLAGVLALGVPLAIALLVGAVILSIFTPQDFARNAGVASVKYGFVVEVYAVVAALTLVGSWDIYQTARDTLQRETAALYLLAHTVDIYGEPAQEEVREEMRAAIRDYAGAVVDRDWPNMQAGIPSRGSDPAFTRLTRAYMQAEPVTQAQQAVAQNVPQWLMQLAEARIARLSVTTRTLSQLVWFLVLTVSVSVLVFQWFIGSAMQALHYAMGGVISLIVGAVLLVSLKLAFPFVGDVPLLSPGPFLEMMEVS
jgi:hypothetical protein